MHCLHLVWSTSRPLTFGQACTAWSFKAHHKDWKIWLWLIEDGLPSNGSLSYLDQLPLDRVEVLKPSMIHPSSTTTKSHSFEELSHLLRFTLLYRFGGLYCDFDLVFYHPLPFALDKDLLFVSLSSTRNADPVFPVSLLFAPLPASPFWKEVEGEAMAKVKGGATLLGQFLRASLLRSHSLDEILDYLYGSFPPVGTWYGLRLLDARSFRPVPVPQAPMLLSPSLPRPYHWLLRPINPFRCFAIQWYAAHPDLSKALTGSRGTTLRKGSILARAFEPFRSKEVIREKPPTKKPSKPPTKKLSSKKPSTKPQTKSTNKPTKPQTKTTKKPTSKTKKIQHLMKLMAKK